MNRIERIAETLRANKVDFDEDFLDLDARGYASDACQEFSEQIVGDLEALAERGVLSPPRLCGLTKAQVRQRSQEAGLFTWDKPAYACLATRVAAGETITRDKLAATEQAEAFLSSLGFSDFRIRTQGGQARLQLPEAQFPLLLEKRREILTRLRAYYTTIALDLEARA